MDSFLTNLGKENFRMNILDYFCQLLLAPCVSPLDLQRIAYKFMFTLRRILSESNIAVITAVPRIIFLLLLLPDEMLIP